MIWLVTAPLLVALLGGAYVGSLHLANRPPPAKVALIHGIIGTIGAALLAVLVWWRGGGSLVPSAAIFGVVIAGGVYLFSFRKREALPKKSAVLIHAAAAVIAFGLFVYGGFMQ